MDPLFENRTEYTDDMIDEALRLHYRVKRRGYRIALILLGMLGLSIGIFYLMRGGTVFGVVFMAYAAFMFLTYLRGHRMYSRRFQKSYAKVNPSREVHFRFFEDEYEIETADNVGRKPYGHILDIVRSAKAMILLYPQSFVIIDPQGFSQGDADAMMHHVGPRMKPKGRKNAAAQGASGQPETLALPLPETTGNPNSANPEQELHKSDSQADSPPLETPESEE